MKTVNALLVTDTGRQPALLSVDDPSSEGVPVLTVDGVAYAPEDLPAGAYLEVDESEMADRTVIAGYVLEPPHSVKRRSYSMLGRVYGVVLLGGATGSLFWAVRDAMALDLLGALAWVGLFLFLVVLGLGWWVAGGETMLGEQAADRLKARRFRRWLGSVVRRR